jgi:hypothetical protein
MQSQLVKIDPVWFALSQIAVSRRGKRVSGAGGGICKPKRVALEKADEAAVRADLRIA